MYKLSDIKYETKNFWVLKVTNGYEVYQSGVTHSTRVAQISGINALEKAIKECDKRQRNY